MQSPIIAKSNDGEQSFHWAANLSNEKAAANNRAAAFLPAPEWRTNYISEMPETAAFDWRLAAVPHGPDFFSHFLRISSTHGRNVAEENAKTKYFHCKTSARHKGLKSIGHQSQGERRDAT